MTEEKEVYKGKYCYVSNVRVVKRKLGESDIIEVCIKFYDDRDYSDDLADQFDDKLKDLVDDIRHYEGYMILRFDVVNYDSFNSLVIDIEEALKRIDEILEPYVRLIEKAEKYREALLRVFREEK